LTPAGTGQDGRNLILGWADPGPQRRRAGLPPLPIGERTRLGTTHHGGVRLGRCALRKSQITDCLVFGLVKPITPSPFEFRTSPWARGQSLIRGCGLPFTAWTPVSCESALWAMGLNSRRSFLPPNIR